MNSDCSRIYTGSGNLSGEPDALLEIILPVATAGEIDAMLAAANIYLYAPTPDEQQAFAWYTRAATAGNPDAQAALGLPLAQVRLCMLYADGIGVEQDYAEALRLYYPTPRRSRSPLYRPLLAPLLPHYWQLQAAPA